MFNINFSLHIALQEHHSLRQRNEEKNAILCATKHLGDCARMYPGIMESWGHFFKKRNFQARAVRPIHQFNTGEGIAASFGRYNLNGYGDSISWEYSVFNNVVLTIRYTADDVQAVDLVVSRSTATNQVVYGRYQFRVSTAGDLVVYDDQQVRLAVKYRIRIFLISKFDRPVFIYIAMLYADVDKSHHLE